MLAQSLGAYGLLAGAAEGATRVSIWADAWINDSEPFMVAGALVLGGWLILRLLART